MDCCSSPKLTLVIIHVHRDFWAARFASCCEDDFTIVVLDLTLPFHGQFQIEASKPAAFPHVDVGLQRKTKETG